eukprot:scaffold3597_cov395-Prasinococcus_capsulatus_cf.AAC.3
MRASSPAQGAGLVRADELTGKVCVEPPEPRADDGVRPARARRARVTPLVAARPAPRTDPRPGAPSPPRRGPAQPHAFPSEESPPGNREWPQAATEVCPASPCTDACPLMPIPTARGEGTRFAHTHLRAHRGPHEAPCPLARRVSEW